MKTTKEWQEWCLVHYDDIAPSEYLIQAIQDDATATVRTQLKSVEADRDAAIKEANRRDQKWMDGINEAVGRKLDYGDPCSRDNASKALGQIVSERDKVEADAAVMRQWIGFAMEKLGAAGGGKEYDPSWIRPRQISVKQMQEECIQAYHYLHNALATNAGKSLQEWKHKAEELLARPHPGMHTCETSQWFADRDAFLNPKPTS